MNIKESNKLKVEIPVEDWITVLAIHKAVQGNVVESIGNNPLLYSKIARITNEIEKQVTAGMAGQLNSLLPKTT